MVDIKKETFSFRSEDGASIFVYKWTPDNEIKGIVQIVHGMAEHAERYERVAEILTKEGIGVYADDHRGHGKSIVENCYGYLGAKNGFEYLVRDEKALTDIIKKENKEKPIIIMGHSMGSFVTRHYITRYGDEVRGVILSGTGKHTYLELLFGWIIAKKMEIIFGDKKKANLIEKIVFGGYNKKFKPNRTLFDWLSRDEEEVDKFIKSKLCGNRFPVSYYSEFFKGLLYLKKKESYSKVPDKLPMFIFSGDKDPVGGMGKGVLEVYKKYKEAGKNISLKIYENGRHEMLNELNREEVTNDILTWIQKTI